MTKEATKETIIFAVMFIVLSSLLVGVLQLSTKVYEKRRIECEQNPLSNNYVEEKYRYNAGACLTAEEMFDYSKGKALYGWHITELKIYDTPKELRDFSKPCKEVHIVYEENGYLVFADGYTEESITRPPQSWQYVRSEKQKTNDRRYI